MKFILVRHGESEANVLGILSSKITDQYGLTQKGIRQVNDAAKRISEPISTMYVSPLKRTQQTADLLSKRITITGDRVTSNAIKEVDYGIYSGQKNNANLDKTRKAQVGGDYHIRYGKAGENKYDIEYRIINFLIEQISHRSSHEVILIVSHGSITAWIERIILMVTKDRNKHSHLQNGDVRKYFINKKHLRSLRRLVDQLNKNEAK